MLWYSENLLMGKVYYVYYIYLLVFNEKHFLESLKIYYLYNKFVVRAFIFHFKNTLFYNIILIDRRLTNYTI